MDGKKKTSAHRIIVEYLHTVIKTIEIINYVKIAQGIKGGLYYNLFWCIPHMVKWYPEHWVWKFCAFRTSSLARGDLTLGTHIHIRVH